MGTFADRANVDYRCFISSVPFIHVYIHTDILKRHHIYRYIDMYIDIDIYTYISISIHIYAAVSNGKWKTEVQVIFLNPFTVCLLSVFYERTNGSYPIANRLNGLNGLALYTIPLKILITVDLKSYMTCFVL
jgi:hypothetical protein